MLDEQVQCSAPHVVVLFLGADEPARRLDDFRGLDVFVLRGVRGADVGPLARGFELFRAVGQPAAPARAAARVARHERGLLLVFLAVGQLARVFSERARELKRALDQAVQPEVLFLLEPDRGEDDGVEGGAQPALEAAQDEVVEVYDSGDHLFVLAVRQRVHLEAVGRVSVSRGWRRRCQCGVRGSVGQVVSKPNACCG